MNNRLVNADMSKIYIFNINSNVINATNAELLKKEWDPSISVHGYLKLIYTETPRTDGGGGNKVILKNVNGKWEKEDNSVSMSDRELYYACVGMENQRQYAFKYPTGDRFSYNTGFSHAVNDTDITSSCGATMWVTLNHGSSSSWTFKITNPLFDNGSFPNISDR